MNRRVAAALALLLVLGVVIATIATVAGDLPRFLSQIVLLAILLSAGWVALTRSGWERIVAVVVVVAAVVAVVVLQVAGDDNDLLSLVLRIAVLLCRARARATTRSARRRRRSRGRRRLGLRWLRRRTACCS